MKTSSEQVRAGLEILIAMGRTVRELKRVPSGHLYARLMGSISLDQYNSLIGILVKQNLVKLTPSHELVWVGEEGGSK